MEGRSPNFSQRSRREPVAADGTQDAGLDCRVSREPTVEVITQPVMSIELVDQFKHDARTDSANAVDMPLPSQTAGRG